MKRIIKLLQRIFIFLSNGRKLRYACLVMAGFCIFSTGHCQLYSSQEENFAYKVKQIDEFFERFNDDGTLIKDYLTEQHQNIDISREVLIKSLFDLKSTRLQKDEVNSFISCVNDSLNPVRLSFYDDDWYARVKCRVLYEGKEKVLLLLMRVQKEENGASKWVVEQVYADFLNAPDGNNPHAALNPVSHATDFMGLNRAFEDAENLKAYLSSGFQDDQLSKFALELQNNRISFQHVENISYHFFQVEGWLFSVEHFQRSEKNAGWLISRLRRANAKDKEILKETLLREKI